MTADFDKYEKYGAYHWAAFVEHIMTKRKSPVLTIANAVSSFCGKRCKILDLGCGDGLLTFIAVLNDNIVTGIDNNEEGVLLARRLTKYYAGRVKILSCSVEDFRSSELFDAVLCIDVIEHLTDPCSVLSTLEKNLKVDGRALIGTPLFISEDRVEPYHVKEFTRNELDEFLSPVLVKVRQKVFRAGNRQYYLYYGKKRSPERWF